jgi:ABC-type branched-subunit amino acid transport system substrate-binding protein
MKMRIQGKHLLAMVLAVFMIVAVSTIAVGCGGDDETTTTAAGGDTGSTDTGSSMEGEIPIGFLTSYTGELGAYGQKWYDAASMAVDEINAAGGVLGQEIKLYTEDSQTNVEEGVKAARKLINVNNVVAIAGPTSDVLFAIWPIAKDNKVVVCSEAAGTTKFDKQGGDYQFRTVASDSFDGRVAARVLYEDYGIRKLAMLYENDEGRKSIADVTREAFLDLGGEIVEDVAFAPKQSTYSAELKKVADASPEAVWLGAGQESAVILFKDASQRDYQWQWMVSSDIAVPEMFDLVGADVLEGTLTETPSSDTTEPRVQEWNAAFLDKFGVEGTGAFQSNSYDQIIILALALEAAGEASGEGINAHYKEIASPPGEMVYTFEEGAKLLAEGKEINYEGISGPLDFDEYGNVAGSYVSMIAENGEWTEVKFYPASDFEF